MVDSSQISNDSQFNSIKLKNALENLSDRASRSTDANTILAEAMALFKDFFDNLGDPEFSPEELKTGDTPRSDTYNSNLRQIYNDIARFYTELKNLTSSTIKSYNYSQVVMSELKKRAEATASIVLDLNILNNFTRSDVIVAGDDFINMDNINRSAGVGSSKAELVSNGSGVSLARKSSISLSTDPSVTIEVIPIAPATPSGNTQVVNISPTPGNLRRFYEGNYYNFLGKARPEGGSFNIQFIVDPSKVAATEDDPNNLTKGIFLEYGASDEDRASSRLKMLDGNPDTFWECEYLLKSTSPLIPDVPEVIVLDNTSTTEDVTSGGFTEPDSPVAASIQIDVEDLDLRAALQDTLNLVVDLIVTLPQEQTVNFVSINPVLFSKNAFLDVQDISTSTVADGQFRTVDGWDSLRFPKTITPEANEFLTDSQLSASLSPSRYNYTGQGIYPFPTRLAKKIKIRIAMDKPTSQVYERTYALLRNTIDVETTITTTTSKGKLRF